MHGWLRRRGDRFRRLLFNAEQLENPLAAYNEDFILIVGFRWLAQALGVVDVASLLEDNLKHAILDLSDSA